jgi:O-antigen ligase
MSRHFAVLICLPVIWWLWRRDVQVRPKFSPALWIPLFWMLILGSRALSWWLGVGGSSGGNLEGNWFDRALYLGLIFAAIVILSQRGISWGTLTQENKILLLFYVFLLLTVLWAPFPFVAFKRWFKDIGAIFIILLILTEKHPLEATKAVFARCAFVWFPLSEIFAKYFPGIGREYSHSGGTMYSGVTQHKNSLGAIVLVAGLVLLSELFQPNRPLKGRLLNRRGVRRFLEGHHFTILITLAMGLWLLLLSNSKTSQICFVIGAIIVLGHKIPVLKKSPRRVLLLCLIAVPTFLVGETLFGISEQLLALVGRNPTLTDRTVIWEAVKQNPVDPLIGMGYMMYWDFYGGVQLTFAQVAYKTAHNGYLEIYLDGGTLGIFFLVVMLLGIGARVVREFLTGSEYGRLAFAVYVAMLLYNISESVYARRSPLWFAFLLFALEFRNSVPQPVSNEPSIEDDLWSDSRETVSVRGS